MFNWAIVQLIINWTTRHHRAGLTPKANEQPARCRRVEHIKIPTLCHALKKYKISRCEIRLFYHPFGVWLFFAFFSTIISSLGDYSCDFQNYRAVGNSPVIATFSPGLFPTARWIPRGDKQWEETSAIFSSFRVFHWYSLPLLPWIQNILKKPSTTTAFGWNIYQKVHSIQEQKPRSGDIS